MIARYAAWLAGALLCLSACSLLTQPEAAARCVIQEGALDPCPTGQACVEGYCKVHPCLPHEICGDLRDNNCDGLIDEKGAPEIEICGDGVDNDCDGLIDERPDPTKAEICGNHRDDDCDGVVDEGHDQDQDGFSWCGDTGTAGGGGAADCDDYDPTVAPSLPERCDGRDNDCDGRIDESDGSSLCDEGLTCVDQRCVAPDCSNGGAACESGFRCDTEARRCVVEGCTKDSCSPDRYCDQVSGECRSDKRPVGEACAVNGDCASDSCVEATALRLSFASPRLCVNACCTHADCGPSERCHVSSTGIRACVPAALAPYPAHAAPQCLVDYDCSRWETCSVVTNVRLAAPASPERTDFATPACITPDGSTTAFGKGCAADASCASNICVAGAGLFPARVCSSPCGTSDDCEELKYAEGLFAFLPRGYCRYVARGSDYMPICVLNRGEAGSGEFGRACTSGSDCLDGACVGASGSRLGMCANTCCRDRDCPALANGPTRCRPVPFGQSFEMRCMP